MLMGRAQSAAAASASASVAAVTVSRFQASATASAAAPTAMEPFAWTPMTGDSSASEGVWVPRHSRRRCSRTRAGGRAVRRTPQVFGRAAGTRDDIGVRDCEGTASLFLGVPSSGSDGQGGEARLKRPFRRVERESKELSCAEGMPVMFASHGNDAA